MTRFHVTTLRSKHFTLAAIMRQESVAFKKAVYYKTQIEPLYRYPMHATLPNWNSATWL